jgi:propanol-preferring alcohol dehydrogenase
MRAALLEKQGAPLRLTDRQAPEPGSRQVRVRIRCCAVCHTDLHITQGEIPAHRMPVIPGHQIVGVVDRLGEDASAFTIGERVGIPWLHWTDGTCAYCRRGLENLCEHAKFTGYDADGGYAEFTVVAEDFAYRIPPQFSDEAAAPLMCAGIVGYRSFRLSGAKAGDRVGLYGFGASAHIVIQCARFAGCEVYVFTRSAEHRKLAEELGAAWTGRAEDTPPSPLDTSIIFAPAGALVPEALRVTRKAGTVTLAGITMSEIPAIAYDLIYHERILRSVANSTRQDARDFLDLAAKAGVKTEIQRYDLGDVNRALDDMKYSRIRGAAVVRI